MLTAADVFIQVRKVEHRRNLAPMKWRKRIWNSFRRFLNSPSENLMELLPHLDENDIIRIKTDAFGAVSPAHKRFLENEPAPGDDGFVPMSEGTIPKLSSDVISRVQSLRSRKKILQAALMKESHAADARTSDPRPTVHHAHTLPSASTSGPTNSVERRALNAVKEKLCNSDASQSEHEWIDILPPDEDQGPPPAYETLQLTTDDETEDPPPFDEITWSGDAEFDLNPNGKSATAAVEYEDPPPEFTEEDLRLQEAVWAEQRAKKAAAQAAKGQKSLGASVAAALTRADATANGKSATAAVEYEDPPPEFTEEDLRLQEAVWAKQRAKKAAS